MPYRRKSIIKSRRPVFSEKVYNCKNGFCTKIWGPPKWFTLHIMSFNFPNNPTEQQKAYYYQEIMNLQYTLACKACRENVKKNLKKYPLLPKHLKNRKAFSKWMYGFHEIINKMLGKKSHLTYNQVREMYEHFRARDCDTKIRGATEKGCVKAKSGIQCQSIVMIVPDKNLNSLYIDNKCYKHKNDFIK